MLKRCKLPENVDWQPENRKSHKRETVNLILIFFENFLNDV